MQTVMLCDKITWIADVIYHPIILHVDNNIIMIRDTLHILRLYNMLVMMHSLQQHRVSSHDI